VNIASRYESSASILNIVRRCRDLKDVSFWNGGGLGLTKIDFEAIASLPAQKCLQMRGFELIGNALSPLARCKKLEDLYMGVDFPVLRFILPIIGSRLLGLDLKCMNERAVNGALEYCPKLGHLYFAECSVSKDRQIVLEEKIKRGLKRLEMFQVKEVPVRLGTYWRGYDE
jgi:hypothetical protein